MHTGEPAGAHKPAPAAVARRRPRTVTTSMPVPTCSAKTTTATATGRRCSLRSSSRQPPRNRGSRTWRGRFAATCPRRACVSCVNAHGTRQARTRRDGARLAATHLVADRVELRRECLVPRAQASERRLRGGVALALHEVARRLGQVHARPRKEGRRRRKLRGEGDAPAVRRAHEEEVERVRGLRATRGADGRSVPPSGKRRCRGRGAMGFVERSRGCPSRWREKA